MCLIGYPSHVFFKFFVDENNRKTDSNELELASEYEKDMELSKNISSRSLLEQQNAWDVWLNNKH